MFKREANDRIKEQEAVKMIRFKAAFNRLTAGHLDLADKCDICFVAGKEVIAYSSSFDNRQLLGVILDEVKLESYFVIGVQSKSKRTGS